MLKIEKVFADFQYVGHKTKKINFYYPEEGIDRDELDFKIDFKVIHVNDEGENYFGIIRFITHLCISDLCFLEAEIEGAFAGNKDAFDFEVFKKMLRYNGVATLSQISRLQVMNITSNIGMEEPIVVPMINVVALNDQMVK